MAEAAYYDIKTHQGDTINIVFRHFNSDGTAKDYTGYTGKAQVRSAEADVDNTIIAEFTVSILDQTVAANKGGVLMRMLPAVSVKLPEKSRYDCQVTSSDGTIVDTVLRGEIHSEREVTR